MWYCFGGGGFGVWCRYLVCLRLVGLVTDYFCGFMLVGGLIVVGCLLDFVALRLICVCLW